MNNSKKSVYNLVFSLISQLVTIALGLIVPRITMVEYGSETNGLLNSVTQIVAYLILFEAGIQAVALQSLYKPVRNNDQREISEILSAVNINYKRTGIIYFVGLVALSSIFPFLSPSEHSYLTVFCVVLFSGLGNVILFFVQGKYKILLQAEGKTYITTNIQTFITIATNIAKIVLLSLGFNVGVVIFVTFVISLAQALYINAYIKKNYKWIDLSMPPKYKALKEKNAALAHQISGLVFQNTAVLILTIVCGFKVVSVYAMYKLIVSHISSILNIPFNSISFMLGQKFNTEKENYPQIIDTVEVIYSTGIFAIYSVTACLLVPFMRLYTSGINDINYVDYTVAMLFVTIELLTFVRTPLLNTINFAGHFKNTLPQTIMESAINIVVSLICVHALGIYGVLLGTTTALLYRTIDIIIYTNRKILLRSPLKTFSIYIPNTLLLFVFVVVYNRLGIVVNDYIGFIIAGVVLISVAICIFVPVNILCHKKDLTLIHTVLNNKLKRSK